MLSFVHALVPFLPKTVDVAKGEPLTSAAPKSSVVAVDFIDLASHNVLCVWNLRLLQIAPCVKMPTISFGVKLSLPLHISHSQ